MTDGVPQRKVACMAACTWNRESTHEAQRPGTVTARLAATEADDTGSVTLEQASADEAWQGWIEEQA